MVTERLAALCLVTLGLAGCGSLYVAQAASGHLALMDDRRPIEAVIRDPATPDALRVRLETVRDARAFATVVLGLPGNASYRSYVELERPYVVWNVVATPEFSVAPRTWCFPVAGCVAYRGYFREQAARDFALGRAAQGDDVVVAGVAAYSTLGRFADPVLSSMMSYGEDELVAVLFHELAHQLVYVPGDSAFNEAFAVAVEQEGLARWLASRGRGDDVETAMRRRARQAEAAGLFAARRAELVRLYGSGRSAPEMRAAKRAILAALAADLRAFESRHGIRTAYRAWADGGLNNAHVASVATYFGCVPGFERLLERSGRDLPAFYGAVRTLAREPAAVRERTVCRDDSASGDAPQAIEARGLGGRSEVLGQHDSHRRGLDAE
jgi:predicted aminopeptidase